MKRHFNSAVPELMDQPQPVTRELERDLANLRSLNRWFGSHGLIRHFLRCWLLPNSKARILDVAMGSGDIPRLVVEFARRQNISVDVHGNTSERPTGPALQEEPTRLFSGLMLAEDTNRRFHFLSAH